MSCVFLKVLKTGVNLFLGVQLYWSKPDGGICTSVRLSLIKVGGGERTGERETREELSKDYLERCTVKSIC